MKNSTYCANNENAMIKIGEHLVKIILPGDIVYFHGNLGAGKTTLIRSILQNLGFSGNVKSPTYTLIEKYIIDQVKICHLDLYRLVSSEELEYLGIRDELECNCIVLIEWPENGCSILPKPTKEIYIKYHQQGREITVVEYQ
jgi:tRNA threonylcarbamoyladenosine biosynthesis protein TsaE